MELTFETTITVGYANNYDNRLFTVDYDPTLSDLNGFANEYGYTNIEVMLQTLWDDDDSKDILNDYLKYLHDGKYYMMESALRDIDYNKELAQYLVKKYQTQFENLLLEKLCLSDYDTDFNFDENGTTF